MVDFEIKKKYLEYSKKINTFNLDYSDKDSKIKVYYFKYLEYDLNTNRKQPNSKMHGHSFYELHIIVNGENDYNISDEMISVKEGEFILITPGVKHSFSDKTSCFSKFSLCFELKFFENSPLNILTQYLNSQEYLFDKCSPAIMSLVHYIFSEADLSGVISTNLLQWNILSLLTTLIQQCMNKDKNKEKIYTPENSKRPKESDEEFYLSCQEFIKSHLDSKGIVEKLSNHMYLSERQVRRRLINYCGKSAGKIIDEIRCERIKELLLTQASMTDISEFVGLSDEHSLSRFFKRVEGQTPGEYRISMLKNKFI